MAIGDDFTVDYANKRIHHSANNNTYTVRAFYSWLMDTFDELAQIDDPIPMEAKTPFEYELLNRWYIEQEAYKYLEGGAIKTVNWSAGTYNDGIRLLTFGATYTNAVAGDIGKEVGYSGGSPGDTGTLLDYDNAQKKWWIRVDDTGDTFANTATAIDVDDGGGTGTGVLAKASETGDDLHANIYSLGTIEDDPYALIYVEQLLEVLTNARNGNVWWARADGHFDILVKVKEADTEIDDGLLYNFNRQYGDNYDHFEIDLTAGGRNPVPLATSTDINNTTPEYFIFYDVETGGGFAVGDYVIGNSSGAEAEIISLDDWGTEGCLGLGNWNGTAFQDNEALYVSGTQRGDCNGTIGDYYLEYDAETGGGFAVTNVVTGGTTGAIGTITCLQDDGTTGKMVLEMANYFDYQDGEDLEVSATKRGEADGDGTRGIAAMDDIEIILVNGTMGFDAGSDEIFAGDTIIGSTNGGTAYVLDVEVTGGTWGGSNAAGTLTLGNIEGTFDDDEVITCGSSGAAVVDEGNGVVVAHTFDQAMEQQSAYPYDVHIFCADRYIADVYEYLKFCTREAQDQKDFYTFESRVRKVEFQSGGYTPCVESDVGKGVTQATTGDTGTLLEYDNTNRIWTILVDDVTGDWFDTIDSISVDSGTGAGTPIGCSWVGTQEGRIYQRAYAAYALSKTAPFGTFAGGVFFGAQGVWVQDMNSADVKNYQITDSNGAIHNPPNKQSILIGNTVNGDRVGVFRDDGSGYVDKSLFGIKQSQISGVGYVDIDTTIPVDTPATGYVRVVRRDAQGDILGEERYEYTSWSGDRFTLSGLTTEAYDTDDTVYYGYIDDEATTTEISVTVIYTTDRNLVIYVRHAGDIVPFDTTGVFESTGYSTNTIRRTDEIYQ